MPVTYNCERCEKMVTRAGRKPGRFCSHHCTMAFVNHREARGRYIDGAGYVRVIAPKGHPHTHLCGWILEHRLVMEQILGRYLEPHERVHHLNGRRSDNRPENLELWKIKKKDPMGVRAADYHCAGCRCFA